MINKDFEMRKILLLLVFMMCGMMAMADSDQLAKYVPAGTNVIFYVNVDRLMGTQLLAEMRQDNSNLDYVIDGLQYKAEELKLGGNAVKNVLLCRDTGKAASSFYIMETIVPQDKFQDVFVADYAFFNSSIASNAVVDRKEVSFFEVTRKRSPGQKYGAYYITPSIVTIFPMDYLDQTIKAVRSNMPIRGEIANALESMNGNAVAGLLASLKKRDGISTWGPEFDGLIFVEITFDLTGANEEDIYLMARFYCEGTPMASGGVTAGSVSPSATFVKALREKRDMWLNATFGEGDSELKSEVASCINIRLGERRVDMEVKMPAAVYAKLRDLHPDIATECLSVMFDQFQLSEHMSSGSAPAGAAVEAPAEAANLFGN